MITQHQTLTNDQFIESLGPTVAPPKYTRKATPRDTWALATAIDKLGLSPTPAQIALLEKNEKPWQDKSTWTLEMSHAVCARHMKYTIPMIVELIAHVKGRDRRGVRMPFIASAGYEYHMGQVDGKRAHVTTVVESHKDPDGIDDRIDKVFNKCKKIDDETFVSTWSMENNEWGVHTVEEAVILVYEEMLILMQEYKCGHMTPWEYINSQLRHRLIDLLRKTKGQRGMDEITDHLDNEETFEVLKNAPDSKDPYAVIHTIDAVLDAFGTLNPRTRAIAVLRWVEWTDKDIASKLETTPGNIRLIEHRGRLDWLKAYKERGG